MTQVLIPFSLLTSSVHFSLKSFPFPTPSCFFPSSSIRCWKLVSQCETNGWAWTCGLLICFLAPPPAIFPILSLISSPVSLSRCGVPARKWEDVQRFQHHPNPGREERQRRGAELRGNPPGTQRAEEDSTLPPGCVLWVPPMGSFCLCLHSISKHCSFQLGNKLSNIMLIAKYFKNTNYSICIAVT